MEKEFEELKKLYQQRKASATLTQHVVDKKAKDNLAALKRNHNKTIFLFAITALAVFIIDAISSQKIQTSVTGLIVLIGCSLYYAASKMYLLRRLNAIDPTQSVWHAIRQLEQYKALNIFMYTYGEFFYTLVLGAGVYLYLRPVLDQFLLDTTGHTILCFWWIWGACIAWMIFYIFFLKRKRMKKDNLIIEKYINDLNND